MRDEDAEKFMLMKWKEKFWELTIRFARSRILDKRFYKYVSINMDKRKFWDKQLEEAAWVQI